MWWQIDSPRSKRVTNTAARPFDWRFSRNDVNRLLAGSPREPDELTACPLVFTSCDIGGRSGRRACIQLCGKWFRSLLFAVVEERSFRLVESCPPFRSAPTPRPLGVGLGRSIAAGELSVPVVAAVCGLPEVIVNASVTRRSGR